MTIDSPRDRLLSGIASPAAFVQWHFDAISRLPAGATVLAESANTSHEAFRIGKLAWGLGFHPEVQFNDLQNWVTLTADQLAEQNIDPGTIIDDVQRRRDEIAIASHTVATNFAAIVNSPVR